jgi:ribose transport system ATP-binding protein
LDIPATPPIIRLEGVTKRFGGVTALDGVSFGIAPGEVHAIVGENGAGKSTLMKLLAGVHEPDAGRIVLRGEPVRIGSPLEARRRGISIVYQELNLFPHMSVAANLFAAREAVLAGGLLDQRGMLRAARRALEQIGAGIDPGTKVGHLSVAEKQLVEIARALQQEAGILILDEPNSALTEGESARLFEIIRRLRRRGITVLYVSHRLEEVFAISDRITVLRDGRRQGTYVTAECRVPEIIGAMVGRRLEEVFPERRPAGEGAVVLEVRDLRGGRLGPVSFQVRAGEILGFAGLEGAGVDTLFHLLFGLERWTGGAVWCEGRPVRGRSPAAAMRGGWALIPASRRDEGLMMEWPVRKNATLLVLDRLARRLGLIDRAEARATAGEYVRRLNIATDSIEKKVIHLSGGNQQKVLLAKWLAAGPRLLMLNDPTRGVDIGAKAEIYQLCDELARQDLAILFTSSEVEETLRLCDRVLVLHRGTITREVERGRAAKADVMHWMSGGSAGDAGP